MDPLSSVFSCSGASALHCHWVRGPAGVAAPWTRKATTAQLAPPLACWRDGASLWNLLRPASAGKQGAESAKMSSSGT